ncbi:MAG: triple tyrosine motif-containing protein [Halioglobus sp.]|nr:triple tyrosine motif-containing protein [Halioglobus sp.]
MGTDAGSIAIIDIDTGSIIAHQQIGSEHLLITDFKVHRQGILVGTDQGLFIAKKDLSSFSEISHSGTGLISKDIYSIHDNGDYLLIGTKSGIDILTYSPFKLINETNNGVNDEVLDFAEDPSGNIWIGTYNGLFILDRKSDVHERVADSINYDRSSRLFDQRVTAVASIEETIWIGFFDGGILSLDSSDLSSGNQQRFLPGTGIVDILTDDEDGSIWVASFRKGLFRIHENSVTSFRDSGQLDEKSIAYLYPLASSDILIGCLYSTYIYDKTKDTFKLLPFNFDRGGSRPIIYSAKELKSGDIWFGTKDNGFFVWKHSDRTTDDISLSRVASAKHTENLTIYGIQQDKAGDIWLSTNKGIVKLDSDGNFIRRFTMADGLQGMDFTFNSSFQSSDGRIFFGGPGGYNVFRPEEVSTQVDPPKTRLTSVRFTSDSLDNIFLTGDSSTVRLTHKDKFVTFEFSIMEFVNTGDSQFRYMLENYDADWIDNGNSHKATYTNLPTGDYNFRVQGMNSAGIWDVRGDSIALSVLPPPWLSSWAYAVYLMAFCLFTWAAHRVYHSYVVERRAAELAQEMFEAEEHAEDDRQEQIEYQDELIHSAYQHKLDTLNLLNTFVFEEDESQSGSLSERGLSGARKRIHILIILENHIYYQPDGPAADLHSFVDAITPKLLENSPVDPDTVVIINGIPESLIPTAIASPLAIIIYELLENCVQHAFDPDSPANYIILNLEKGACKGTSLSRHTLTINDDGIGAPAEILQMTDPGSGLYVVQAIVRQLEGHIELSSEQGTRIVVSLVEPE